MSEELIQEILMNDVSVIRNFEEDSKFNKKIFSPDHLKTIFGDLDIDVVIQNPNIFTLGES